MQTRTVIRVTEEKITLEFEDDASDEDMRQDANDQESGWAITDVSLEMAHADE